MNILEIEEVVELHEANINNTGGGSGIRDFGLLESAVLGCCQTFGGVDLYPTIVDKAAWMAYAICKNHPFVDGNKRSAVVSMLTMLDMNDITLSYTQQELIDLGMGVANGEIDFDEIVTWIHKHM